jgi:hypothetical protein
MNTALKQFAVEYPLASTWAPVEVFEQTLVVDGLQLFLVGVSTKNAQGIMVTGSAVSCETPPFQRAFFELLERTSIVDRETMTGISSGVPLTLIDESGHEVGKIAREEVFPDNPSADLWRYAKSNGVAAHIQCKSACEAARLELIERDRLLRSWLGEFPPQALSNFSTLVEIPHVLARYYEFEAYKFSPPSKKRSQTSVVGLFGFPKSAIHPRVCGFGARESDQLATEAALREFLQGMSFLWGEEIPSELPAFSPTPDYHQECYLHSSGIAKIKAWLSGKHDPLREWFSGPKCDEAPKGFQYIDLTPTHLKGQLYVVKAIHPCLLRLTFGKDESQVSAGFPKDLLVHPIT